MSNISSLAKISLMLLTSAAFAGSVMAQGDATSSAPEWPSQWSKPANASPTAAAGVEGALQVLDQPFEAAPETIALPVVDENIAAATQPADAATAPATSDAADPLGIDALLGTEVTPSYISEGPATSVEAETMEAPSAAVPALAQESASEQVLANEEPVEAPGGAQAAAFVTTAPVRIAPANGASQVSAGGATEFAEGSAQDPVVANAANLVRENGLLARQSEMGEGLILMERQMNFANTVNSLIGILGPFAEIEVAPGVYKSYADTPAGLKAQLEMKQLERDAQFADLDFEFALKERQDKLAGEVEVEEKAGGLLPLRSDGGEFQDINNAGPQAQVDPLAALDPAVLTALTTKITAEVQAKLPKPEAVPVPPVASTPFSLREVFGAGEDFVAILSSGADRIRVRQGDNLPNGVKVISIGVDYVEMEVNGETTRLSIRG